MMDTKRGASPNPRSASRKRWAAAAMFAAAVVPPLLAFAGHQFFEPAIQPWALFLAAILTSAWLGGLLTGLAATALSTVLVWTFLIPPSNTLIKHDPVYGAVAIGFVGIGVAISLLQHRFKKSKREVQTALDMTRQLNERLEKAIADRAIFGAFTENSSDFIGIAEPDGTPIYVNPAGRRMVGLPADLRIRSTRMLDYYPDDTRAFAQDVIMRQMHDQGHWEGETFFRNWTTGESIPVWDTHFVIRDPSDGRVLGMGTITRDMSAIVHARTQLERANERLHAVTQDLGEAQRIGRIGSWFYDPKTDLAQWSDELFRIHDRRADGRAPKFHSPQPPLFTPESTAVVDAALQQLLEDGEPYEVDAEVIRADGSTGWVTIRGVPVRDRDGKIIGATGTTQDITELKKLQKLRQEWMSVVAHDLRQPIGVIKMSAELLPELHDGDLSKGEEDIAKRIRNASIDLSRMVDDLLDVSRIEAHRLTLDRVWIDPRAVVDEAIARLSHITTGVHVNVEGKEGLPAVCADPGRIGQVLGNLLSNAIKYGDKTSDIEVTLAAFGDGVTISVSNHGKGIAPEDLPKLFQRFARARDDRHSGVHGLGLGLYIAKGLVEAHGGRLWGESVPGETTTFHFTLPARPPEQSLSQAA
jgi:PAS domain S-box-containing protein